MIKNDARYNDILNYRNSRHFIQTVKEARKYDIVFQTVPAPIITDAVILHLKSKALIIELSSGYIGTDCLSAENNSIKVKKAGGLPEKTAPITAGNILTESVISIINERLPDHTLGG